MRIMGLAATAALMAAAGGSAATACEAPGACAYAPSSQAYVFQPPGPMTPRAHGPAANAYVFSPGPTPAYAAGEEQSGYEERGDDGARSHESYGGQAHRGGHAGGFHHEGGHVSAYHSQHERTEDGGYRDGGRYGAHGGMGSHGGMQSYGEVSRAEGYLEPYTPAFGRGVVTQRPYTGSGYGYRFGQHGCNTGCGANGTMGYGESHAFYQEEAKPVQVGPDFFYGGLTGGAGYGVDGGGFGGGGGFFGDSGFGYSATQAFSRGNALAFSGASAHASARASATAFAFSYGGGKMMKHGGGGGCGMCGGHGKGGGKH